MLDKIESKYLLIPKLLFLILNLQYYTLHQFRAQFAIQKFNVPTGEYGKFNGYIQALTFFSNIAIGIFSDKTGKHKKILNFLICATFFILLLFYNKSLMNLSHYSFWAVLLLYLVFNNPKQPLFDKLIFDYLTELPYTDSSVYGKQRVWGTVAYTLATYIVEYLIITKDEKVYDFTNLKYYSLILSILVLLSLNSLKTKEKSRNVQKFSGFKDLFKNKEFSFFIFIMFLNAITRQTMSNYLAIFHNKILRLKSYDLPEKWPFYIKNFINIFNKSPVATITIFGTSFEMLCMFFSNKIINYMGFFFPLLLAQILSVFRFAAYLFMDKNSKHVYLYTCFIELIKGLYFGLAHMSAIHIAVKLSPGHLKATSQMIYQGIFGAFGAAVSGYIFSHVFDSSLKAQISRSSEIKTFNILFTVNILISTFTIFLFIMKYGIYDKVLFNRNNEMKKLNKIENDEKNKEIKI